jgi:hypothetical protein
MSATGYFASPIALLYQDQLQVKVVQVGSTQPGTQILLTLAGSGLES